ncbi:hypothetical protein ACTWJ8_40365 (plasmid) [Streptomyces sp. SDT5-1]|uniref:hypothetical protein n=1 Tax=Streptomyces sp. SDT5-1 TaxID=3406418 RepID=UPI003FCFBBF4
MLGPVERGGTEKSRAAFPLPALTVELAPQELAGLPGDYDLIVVDAPPGGLRPVGGPSLDDR